MHILSVSFIRELFLLELFDMTRIFCLYIQSHANMKLLILELPSFRELE